MLHNGYDIPTIAYFESDNVYHGNVGSFRYRIEKSGEELKSTIWLNDLCYELREDAQETAFALTADGLLAAIDWIEQKRRETQK